MLTFAHDYMIRLFFAKLSSIKTELTLPIVVGFGLQVSKSVFSLQIVLRLLRIVFIVVYDIFFILNVNSEN